MSLLVSWNVFLLSILVEIVYLLDVEQEVPIDSVSSSSATTSSSLPLATSFAVSSSSTATTYPSSSSRLSKKICETCKLHLPKKNCGRNVSSHSGFRSFNVQYAMEHSFKKRISTKHRRNNGHWRGVFIALWFYIANWSIQNEEYLIDLYIFFTFFT